MNAPVPIVPFCDVHLPPSSIGMPTFGSRALSVQTMYRPEVHTMRVRMGEAIARVVGANPQNGQVVQAWVLVRDFGLSVEGAAYLQTLEHGNISRDDVERCVAFVDSGLERLARGDANDTDTVFDFPRLIRAHRINVFFTFAAIDTQHASRARPHAQSIYQTAGNDLFLDLAHIVGATMHDVMQLLDGVECA